MDKITKYLRRLSQDDLLAVESAIKQLIGGNLKHLNIKKLRGHKDVYRMRVGSTRIIFRSLDEEMMLLDISKRDESTYKKW